MRIPILIDIFLAAAGLVVGVVLVGYVDVAGKRMRQRRPDEAENGEYQNLAPEDDEEE
ncbi:uncharacterized protein P174DRAFT_74825 [Aspergillus novofumigatus IBT 16806]|uniref:Uncharacterized protein n=1 Tax=Aspergillus novofumigatus (strain IBT 16806) TaxID=1392255 RepID=A0A2I1BSF3_ASPN1|nr:uncharacterized protein P174DRAFT_74825 [Aspergillus novofumigatus IBT 16806]PKX88318.1 hypothetical protein P174DRAFT_74825 [Aspergillus novofumigatus IBT 16806]